MKIKRIMTFFIAIMVLTAVGIETLNVKSEDNNDADRTVFNGHSYKIYKGSYSWDEAKILCEQVGGHLATITSQEEEDFIQTLNATNSSLWIGGYRDGYFNWKWVTGEEWNYTYWGSGEPNNSGNVVPDENCVAVWPKYWNDLNANNKYEQSGYICEWEKSGSSIICGKFKYHSEITKKTEEYYYTYNEQWFSQPSTTYNHELAKMSICTAMSAASTTPDNIKGLFSQLGFGFSNSSVHYPTPEYHYIDMNINTTIGYAIGSKELEDDDCLLLLVAVRGGGYKDEWAGNFDVGGLYKLREHHGFAQAATTVKNGIVQYISDLKTDKKIKIWITGYSRAAAVTNITAHYLNDSAEKGEISNLSVSDIFAYCFECPRTVDKKYATKDSNIFNIINDADPVTQVAPEKWNYERYGTDYYLPVGSYCNNYSTFYTAQIYEYQKILAATTNELPNNKTLFKTKASDFSEKELNKIAKEYSTTMNGQIAFTKNLWDSLAEFYTSPDTFYIMGNQRRVAEAIKDALAGGDLDSNKIGRIVENVLMANAVMWAKDNTKTIKTLVDNGGIIFQSHYPELCLSWMYSLSGLNDVRDSVSRKLIVNCPVNVEVYDSNGTLVASIGDSTLEETDYLIESYTDIFDQKTILLPGDEEFEIRITATDDGSVSCQIEEYDSLTKETINVVNYNDIAIQKDDILTGTMSAVTDTQDPGNDCIFYDKDSIVIAPTNIMEGIQAKKTVSVLIEGDGDVFGSGEYTAGQYIILSATPDIETTFIGWEDTNGLISTDLEFRFRVTDDAEIKAVFTSKGVPKESSPKNWIWIVVGVIGVCVAATAIFLTLKRSKKKKEVLQK